MLYRPFSPVVAILLLISMKVEADLSGCMTITFPDFSSVTKSLSSPADSISVGDESPSKTHSAMKIGVEDFVNGFSIFSRSYLLRLYTSPDG